jgi:hypothetical protein
MNIINYTFLPEEFTAHLNGAKDLILEILLRENKISEQDFEKYTQEYAIILVNKNSFWNFCKNLFTIEQDKKTSMVIVKRV